MVLLHDQVINSSHVVVFNNRAVVYSYDRRKGMKEADHVQCKTVTSYIIKSKTKKNNDPT